MKRSLILMIFLIITSLMIAPALAQTQTQKQDQQTQTTEPASVAASDKTSSTVIATEEAGSSKRVVIGNKDTKRYHLFGMPFYNKVSKDHRVYFDSEQQAIDNGYYKAGTGKDLAGHVPPVGGKTIKNQTTPATAKKQQQTQTTDPASVAASDKTPLTAEKQQTQTTDPVSVAASDKTPLTAEKQQTQTTDPASVAASDKTPATAKKQQTTDEPEGISQKLQNLQNQVDNLREQSHTREKLTITKEEQAEQEKAVLTAAGRDYTMMQKGKFELDYSLRYEYISSSSIISATTVVAHANHTIRNIIDVQYGLRNNITTDINVPYIYVYDKSGSDTAKDNSDWGDITLSLDYQPFKSGGDWPTTTITMSAILPTGRSPYEINRDTDLPTGGGLYGFSLGVNMSKSIDPAVVFGAISGSYHFTGRGLSQNINGAILDEVKPGMSFSAAIGLAYAISYALSMNIQFQYGYNMSTDYSFTNAADMTVPAYSTGSLIIGMGWRVSPKTTLSFSLGIGLTKDDPDFFLLFRVPFTF
jgi:uncharacterized protein YcfL